MPDVLEEPDDGGVVRDAVEDSVDVSVVIACRDEACFLVRQLAAVAAQECALSWELVIADNGSADRSIEIAEGFRSRLPSLRIVDASGHVGPAAARNEGVRQGGLARGASIPTGQATAFARRNPPRGPVGCASTRRPVATHGTKPPPLG